MLRKAKEQSGEAGLAFSSERRDGLQGWGCWDPPGPTDFTQIFTEDETQREMSSVPRCLFPGQDVHSCSDLQLEFSDVRELPAPKA